MHKISINTHKRSELVDITSAVQDLLNQQTQSVGLCVVFVPHTTAAVTINENADPDVKTDMLLGLERISPLYKDYRHLEGNSDAHIKASLLGASETILVENGRLVLGTWQALYLAEFDGPRTRTVLVNFFVREAINPLIAINTYK